MVVWARSGRELFYLKLDGTMVTVPIEPGGRGGFSAGVATSLFQGRYFATLSSRTYDVSPDGRRFLMIKNADSTDSQPSHLVVVLNFFEELKRLVPAR